MIQIFQTKDYTKLLLNFLNCVLHTLDDGVGFPFIYALWLNLLIKLGQLLLIRISNVYVM